MLDDYTHPWLIETDASELGITRASGAIAFPSLVPSGLALVWPRS